MGRRPATHPLLTREQVIAIYTSDQTVERLADEYQRTRGAISKIRNGRTFADITDGLTPGRRRRYRKYENVDAVKAARKSQYYKYVALRVSRLDTPETRELIASVGCTVAASKMRTYVRALAIIRDRMFDELQVPLDETGKRWREVRPRGTSPNIRICVSDQGDCLVCHRNSRMGIFPICRWRIPSWTEPGQDRPSGKPHYLAFHTGISVDGLHQRTSYVHHLVLLAFVGHRPSRHHYACHFNDDPLDNRVANLRWDSSRNNILDNLRNRKGGRSFDFDTIFAIYTDSEHSPTELAKMYGTRTGSISRIQTGVCWSEFTKHLVPGAPIYKAWRATTPRDGRVLTVEMVKQIRRDFLSGESTAKIARRMNLAKPTVEGAIYGKSHSNVLDPPPVRRRKLVDICTVPFDPTASRAQHAVPYPFDTVTGKPLAAQAQA